MGRSWLLTTLALCLIGVSQQSGYGDPHGSSRSRSGGYGHETSYKPQTYHGDNDNKHRSGYDNSHDTGYGSRQHNSGYGNTHNSGYGNTHNSGYGSSHQTGYGYEHKSYGIECYQCSYSPDKTYYKKVKSYVEYPSYGYGHDNGYDRHGNRGGYGYQQPKGYYKEKVVPVTVKGGWDKCRGPFSHYQAHAWGIDTWKCHSKCYTRKDYNGDIVRGCYKGEYGIDPYKGGCQKAGGSEYCFCEGDKCNNKGVGYGYH